MLYVSPYLVTNQGGCYTKHIYIGGEGIVSKICDFASYGPDPRRIEYAGSEAGCCLGCRLRMLPLDAAMMKWALPLVAVKYFY